MAQPALAVANYFINRSRTDGLQGSMTPMKLLKLVYYAHSWYVTIKNKPLLREPVEAWKYGPVVPKIYEEFSRFKASPVEDVGRDDNGNEIKFSATWGKDEENEKILSAVWDKYKNLTGTQLSALSHRPSEPWYKLKSEKGYNFDVDRGIQISEIKIRECFSEIANGS